MGKQASHVCRFHDFEEIVRGVGLQTPHAPGGVEEGETLRAAEGDDALAVERLRGVRAALEVVSVIVEEQTHDAPEVVDPVGVEEVHAPPCAGRRETAEEEGTAVGRQEGFERMAFGFHGGENVGGVGGTVWGAFIAVACREGAGGQSICSR